MAKIAGIDYSTAANAMTVAVRAFKLEMTEAQSVTDTYSALAAKFAVSSAEIANGLQKFAAVAKTVGLSYDYATTALATIVATTRQSADVVGTALKTLFARI